MRIGAWYQGNRSCEFIVWAPLKDSIEVKVISPEERIVKLEKDKEGYWRGRAEDLLPGAAYFYVIDGKLERPDPGSFYQPEGVHKPSGVIDHASFQWKDRDWQGIPLEAMIMYELHVGTFSQEGTFEGIIQKLDYFKKLGVNAIEIMPVAQYPGDRNWGYDGVHSFAVQNSYGGPEGLKRLIDQCHQKGIAVILDVVYNHLGPEGNYLADFGPYFTPKYQTPWGWAVNFDAAYSPGVRNYFIQNALYWFEWFHVDALRLDAIHGIFDFSAKHILRELAEKVEKYSQMRNRKHYLIAESDLNDSRVIESKEKGGQGIDAQWLDDFHHSLRTLITDDKKGYYCDFGSIEQLAKAYREGFVYSGDYSTYRKKYFGSSSKHLESKKFVAFTQDHDQVGNRMMGERLSQLVDFESLKLAAGAMMFSPYIPMLFMGEEFAANTPFLYFISHLDDDLVKAVQQGRKKEFSEFRWEGEPPDPFSPETFLQSKLKWGSLELRQHKIMFEFYCKIINARQGIAALKTLTRAGLKVFSDEEKKLIIISREFKESGIRCYLNFNKENMNIVESTGIKMPFKKVIDSADKKWNGPGSLSTEILSPDSTVVMRPKSFVLFRK
ncbi:MAG: malto-oligosyltrehalose trehalohydrolase [Candidatus Omnitrophica bacterium]|nr:malto-oligosyltrehalose trehalohydrolase [Candidatus Omnitrophota bacterium]MBU4478651.1 malto-oligosyltrehalose trehalohydrolase [Candidatus Omnitrophota bacterium]